MRIAVHIAATSCMVQRFTAYRCCFINKKYDTEFRSNLFLYEIQNIIQDIKRKKIGE